jgi:alanyl-tRNA synthetase
MLTLSDVRDIYLNFFKKKGHLVLPSSSLIPNDPTLMFTNSGMVQFKNYFAGLENPPSKRMATCQKSVRAGGKHNDLDNVGYTARHHTFFEMLGNFSIGDYFKKDAINWSWELLTSGFNLPPEKLLVTVYYDDEETIELWKKISKLPDDKIIKIKTKDNFWEMGDMGPCGPCTEIFYDHGEGIKGDIPGTIDEDGDRYIEIWNNVFTQFERLEDGSLKPLKNKNIDTGMGLERITAVLQGVHNNYDIDLFKRLIENSKNIIGDGNIASHRIIADHLRSSSFLIADGVLPSNEGRGYVLRRIMRRAMRHIYQLGATEPKMFRLVNCLVDAMGDHYTELKEREDLIIETLEQEEIKFGHTLNKGLILLEKEVEKNNKKVFSGLTAFTLYDTYGFPLDLTQDILKNKDIKVNTDEFDEEMAKQKEKSKWNGSGDQKNDEIYFKVKNKIEKTEFIGYDVSVVTAKILSIVKDKVEVSDVKTGDEFEFFVDKTPFYGEMGGQCGDSGIGMQISENGKINLPFSVVEILDVKQPFDNYFLHKGKLESGNLKVGDFINLAIDKKRRDKISANHSATHLLEATLRKLFGDTVIQKGSSVTESSARYDFTLNKQINKEEQKQIEDIINKIIFENTDILTKSMPIEEAKKTGAISLFEEKYKDIVRVVFIGEKENEKFKGEDISTALHFLNNSSLKKYYSIDFCGGTHVRKTGEIGIFKIKNESSIGSGIRRIEFLTGFEALKFLNGYQNTMEKIAKFLEINTNELYQKIELLNHEHKTFKKELENTKKQNLSNIEFKEEKIKDITFASIVTDISLNDLKSVIIDKQNKKYNTKSIIVALSIFDNKNNILIGVSKDMNVKIKANQLIKVVGRGGGQEWFATGIIQQINGVIEKIKDEILKY